MTVEERELPVGIASAGAFLDKAIERRNQTRTIRPRANPPPPPPPPSSLPDRRGRGHQRWGSCADRPPRRQSFRRLDRDRKSPAAGRRHRGARRDAPGRSDTVSRRRPEGGLHPARGGGGGAQIRRRRSFCAGDRRARADPFRRVRDRVELAHTAKRGSGVARYRRHPRGLGELAAIDGSARRMASGARLQSRPFQRPADREPRRGGAPADPAARIVRLAAGRGDRGLARRTL